MQPPVYRLPPDWVAEATNTPLAELVDWWEKLLGVPENWRENAGMLPDRPARIAVLDTGCDVDHPDLKGQVIAAKDFTRSINGYRDVQGHGTWCASMIAAASNDTGIRGVCYKSQLIIAKVLGDNGSGTDDQILHGLQWAYDQGADAFSLSLGGRGMSNRLRDAFDAIAKAGRFTFAAAGNDGGTLNDPAAFPSVVSVGAVGKDGRMTAFTSRDSRLTILAPGYDMVGAIPGGRYAKMTGTSMACPLACAIGVLAWCKHMAHGGNSDLKTVDDMKAHLKRTAKPTVDGFGLIDPTKLLGEHGSAPQPAPVEVDIAGVIAGRKYKLVPV